MASVTMQRDLVVNLKRETFSNVGILSKLQQMPSDLSRQVFKENALEKPTQNVFNHLSYYLVSIIDPQVCDKFSWPLYDTKTERTYRGQLSAFINDYSSKGLVAPVMSSYLVNPGCYKVTMLIFQLSQLAVQRLLVSKMNNKQKDLYSTMTDRYKNSSEEFLEVVEKETHYMKSKFSNYLRKREAMEKMAAIFRERITSMEKVLSETKAQEYINNLVDGYISQRDFDENTKNELLKIKNVNVPAPIFNDWLLYVDEQMKELECKWTEKVCPFLKICMETRDSTEALIARCTGEADRSSFMVEYNHKTDEIDTKELQSQVNSQQKYILMNIVRDEKLYFPNLVRSFLISICYILKDTEIDDDIFKFNKYLESGRRDFNEVVSAMRILNNRVLNAEARLEPSPTLLDQSSISIKEYEIPPLPDLSDLKATREHPSLHFNTFTPISMSKHQFNLRRKHNSFSYSTKSNYQTNQPKSMFATPFQPGPRDDFLKNLSCRVSSYCPDVSQNFHNLSVISQVNPRGNETIAECSGFTKQQIMRLLSTKKSSSSKKMKQKMERPSLNVKKGGLFNESSTSNESNGLFRSYSSPNLFENREKRSFTKSGKRKLSIMPEDCPSLLEVSGIAALEKDDMFGTPEGIPHLENSRKLMDATSLPVICITPDIESKTKDPSAEKVIDFNKVIEADLSDIEPVLKEPKKSFETKVEELKTETPKNTSQLIRKTSSLEKIINRFKKVRANVLPSDSNDEAGEFKTIVEEKENTNSVNVDVFTANKILLPDLLSPSCSALSIKSTDYLDQFCMELEEREQRKPRQSLGTALGVDNTFLDQFDLID
ncbi:uncharacterized protein LOC135083977 [Ostrinia nubilalis]|uniref:uncharacterized protein LOC135083977 n=1 Tax=Ostrinia nubilalis TaxID=29057 RepID=UPI00308232AA